MTAHSTKKIQSTDDDFNIAVVGYFAVQLAKLHGYPVAITCSPRNFDYVKNAGATHVFDYNDTDVVTKLQTALPTLSHIFDTIGNASSSATAAAALDGRPGVLCTVRPGKANTEEVPRNIKVTDVFVFTAFPTAHTYRELVHWPVCICRSPLPPPPPWTSVI